MNKIKVTAATAMVALFGGTAWLYKRADGKELPQYRTATVTRASIKSTVSATGALSAVRTVQVGTQVSGQLAQIFVDFNDHVKKGQLLARIDPTLQQQAVEDAQAQVERAQATLTQAQDDYNRNKQLLDAKVITAQEFSTVQSNFSVQQATVKSARIALDRAKQNLSYTSIYAPIDGVIVERDVDVGQTVAASLSAPQLFIIANDLSEMQILASVDESDIGVIKEGQPVQFTVQSYPGQTFTGAVKQVRLQSKTQDNVVNYTVVVGVKNDTQKLLPGMTATVTFETGSADNALSVPNAALRVKPTEAMLAAAPNSATRRLGDSVTRQLGDSAARRLGDSAARRLGSSATRQASGSVARSGGGGQQRGAGQGSTAFATLWTLGADGKTVKPIRVRTGLTDGQRTAITARDSTLTEGTQVIIGIGGDATAAATPARTTQSGNPFQPQRGPGGPRGF
ncbi:MAG TPA: efflux RND transporter periplasmic adaptor subunit [Gemmatimonadaceae bacterium]|nr:efflux RND transporter periplasmic adaptor subunit [Gemmatimonadaceae bacterium]